MIPWVYEFHWTAFHIIFLTVFGTVGLIVATTMLMVFNRSKTAKQTGRVEAIQWHSDFHDLPSGMRTCRHEFSGDVQHRTCNNEFRCESCSVHLAFVSMKGEPVSPLLLQNNVLGFSMPHDRYYHRGHAWVKKDPDGNCLVGLDDFGTRLVGTIESMELPEIGKKIHLNGIGWTIHTLGVKLRILSPLEGEVIAHGTEKDRWLMKIRPSDPQNATVHLLRETEIRPWIMREMERLQFSFATSGAGITLADGGELIPDFHKHFPNADWDGVLGQMFLEA